MFRLEDIERNIRFIDDQMKQSRVKFPPTEVCDVITRA